MLPRNTIRGWHMDNLRKSLVTMNSILRSAPPQAATIYRDGGTGWTVLQVLCHLRDYEALFLERGRATVEQDTPTLVNPDPDTLAVERRYHDQDIKEVYDEWVQNRQALLRYLEGVDEAAWDRSAIHPRRGQMSLQDQLTLITWHDANHIEQITRTLVEQQTT